MQVILLLILSFVASAQEVCDLYAAEKECFSQICTIPSDNILIHDPVELLKEIKKQSDSKLPSEVTKSISLQLEAIQNIKALAKPVIDKNQIPQVVDDFLKDIVDARYFLTNFYYGSLKCASKGLPCDVIVSDMENIPEGVIKTFKKISEYDEISEAMNFADLETNKKYILYGLEMLAPMLKDVSLEEERKKIEGFKTRADLLSYYDNGWLSDFDKLARLDLVRHKTDLVSGITERTKELLEHDHSREKMTDSCLLANHLGNQIASKATDENFKKHVGLVLSSMKKNFSSKLSPESMATLEKELSPSSFQLLKINPNEIAPSSKVLQLHINSNKNDLDPAAVLIQLPKLTTTGTYGCSLTSLYPVDHYILGNINISQYTVAHNGAEIIAHEVGHWISDNLSLGSSSTLSKHSSEKLRHVRKCVQSFYPKSYKVNSGFNFMAGDNGTSEEDFSDWFAAHLNFKRNTFCDIENMVTQGKRKNLFLPDDKEVHSNTLFRELNLRIQKGDSIPKSCRDLMDSHPDINIVKCE